MPGNGSGERAPQREGMIPTPAEERAPKPRRWEEGPATRRSGWRRSVIAAVLLSATATGTALGQESEKKETSAAAPSGGVWIGTDLYDNTSEPAGSAPSRRPASLTRMVIDPTISSGERFSMPMKIIITIPETTTMLSRPASPGIGDFFGNPANSFGIAPKFGWARFNLGTQTPRLSELSGGDIQLFGVGVELSPGDFRISAAAGTVGRSVAADSARLMPGEYARQAYLGRIAYVGGGSEVGVNIARIRDDGASIPALIGSTTIHPDTSDPSLTETIATRHPLMPIPEESLTATVNVRVPIAEGVRVIAEAGGSLFTRDMEAGPTPEPIAALRPLMAQHLSTRADIAGSCALEIEEERWGIALGTVYVGPGYRTLAYPWMQSDRLDVTAAPHVTLLDGGLTLHGSIGWRRNNLAASEEGTTTQLIGSLNADARIGEEWTIDVAYSDYGVRNTVRADTLRVETISRSISLTPAWSIGSGAATHVISASIALDDYHDYTPATGAGGSNRTRSITGAYSLTLTGIPLTADIAGSWLANDLAAGELTIAGGSAGAGYALFDNAVKLGANISLTRSTMEGFTADESLTLGLKAAWRLSYTLLLSADAQVTRYSYGSARPDGSFRESLLRTAAEWRW